MARERMTKQQRAILEFLGSAGPAFGREVIKGTKLKSGTVYPGLALLARKGYVESEREDGDPSVLGRPLRVHYRLTTRGTAELAPEPRHVLAPLVNSGGKL